MQTERVDLRRVGYEQQIHGAGRRDQRCVMRERARIGGEVFARAELRRVHEDAHDDPRSRFGDELRET